MSFTRLLVFCFIFHDMGNCQFDFGGMMANDIIFSPEQLGFLISTWSQRKATNEMVRLWPNAVVPYKIDPSREDIRPLLEEAMQMWQNETCLQFIESADIEDAPHIVFNKLEGCWSQVGIFNESGQDLSVGEGCEVNVYIAHEIGHAIGLWHEQDRPDRDRFLDVRLNNMDEEDRIYFRRIKEIDTYGLPYDYSSLMHYEVFAMSNNGRMTLIPLNPLMERVMGKAKKPSYLDIKLVNLMYNCQSKCIVSNAKEDRCWNNGYLSWSSVHGCRCVCPPGFGGSKCQDREPEEKLCGGFIKSETVIASPNYPDYSPENTKCVWWIRAPRTRRVKLYFEDFDVLSRELKDSSCPWDNIRIRLKNVFSDSPGFTFCGDELASRSIKSSGRDMILIYSTNSNESKGFKAHISFVNCPLCG